MADPKPRSPSLARTLIAPMVFAGIIGVIIIAAVLLGSSRKAAPPPPQPTSVEAPPLNWSAVAQTPVGRADFIAAANVAASAYASAAPLKEKDALVGRDFQVRLPFGCQGPDPASTAQASYQYDAPSRTVKIVARVADWTDLPIIQALTRTAKIEAAEGFWLARPWTASEDCPVVPDVAAPATPTPPAAQTLGLAELFTSDDSRLPIRDGRAYEFARRIPQNNLELATHAYRLGLAGRIVGYPDGRAVHCWAETPDHRPVCLFAVTVNDRWFEDAATGERLTDWRE